MAPMLGQGFAAGSAWQCVPRQHFAFPSFSRRPFARNSLRAVAEDQQKNDEGARLTFGANRNAARGYTEDDSAGQANIFAVEPKQYVQGGSRDTGENSNSIALAAGAFGVGILVLGLIVSLRGAQPASTVAVQQLQKEASNYRTLGQYKEQFAQLQMATAAPAVAELPAPGAAV